MKKAEGTQRLCAAITNMVCDVAQTFKEKLRLAQVLVVQGGKLNGAMICNGAPMMMLTDRERRSLSEKVRVAYMKRTTMVGKVYRGWPMPNKWRYPRKSLPSTVWVRSDGQPKRESSGAMKTQRLQVNVVQNQLKTDEEHIVILEGSKGNFLPVRNGFTHG